jgi:DoxX-like protein
MTREKARTIAYWVTTILGPSSFVIGGYLHLTRDPQVMATLAHLGYPPYFAAIMGAWKLLGAIAITVPGIPRVKEWAYAGFFFDLSGAAATRAFVGDGAGDIAAPLVFLALVAASWALRPASRQLGSTAAAPGAAVNLQEAVFV